MTDSMAMMQVKDQLAARAGAGQKGTEPVKVVQQYLEQMKVQIARALPKHITPDRLARVALTTIRTTPKLLGCSIESLMGSVMLCAQLGLEPGPLGEAYIIPYGTEATFILGYKGMLELLERTGKVTTKHGHCVYQNDYFDLEYGFEVKFKHIPWHLRKDVKFDNPGNMIGAYFVICTKEGGKLIHYMPKFEIERHKDRSKSKNNGPWITDYEKMAIKTVIRDAFAYMPKSIEILRAMEADEHSIKEIHEDISEPLPVTYEAQFTVIENKEQTALISAPAVAEKQERKPRKSKEQPPQDTPPVTIPPEAEIPEGEEPWGEGEKAVEVTEETKPVRQPRTAMNLSMMQGM